MNIDFDFLFSVFEAIRSLVLIIGTSITAITIVEAWWKEKHNNLEAFG